MLSNLQPTTIIINMLVLGIAMTVHEFAHNFVAWKMGDPVPKQQGRLTLNPLVHINWIGWLMFAFIGFGVLGSAPISARRMRDPRWGFMAAVAAGPLSNLALAIVAAIPLQLFDLSYAGLATYYGAGSSYIAGVLFGLVYWNVLLFVFNLIPLFPIDGWHIVLTLLPGTWLNRMQIPVFIQQNMRPLAEFLKHPAFKWSDWRQTSYYVFIGLILLSFMPIPGFPSPLGIIISQPTSAILGILLG
jgi:Zn-dependent protease